MTKPREKKREELQAEIEDGKKKIRQLENREKVLRQKLSQEERRTRSHRLIVRGAVFESIVPEAKTMTDEEAAAFLRLVCYDIKELGKQQNGFSREASIYIQTPSNYSKYVTDGDGEKKIKRSILECGNIGVETEAQDIQFNIPELFVE